MEVAVSHAGCDRVALLTVLKVLLLARVAGKVLAERSGLHRLWAPDNQGIEWRKEGAHKHRQTEA